MDTDTLEQAALTVVLTALVVYRASRLITTDTVFQGPRLRVVGFLSSRGPIGVWLAKLAICAACMSFWVSIPATVLADRYVGLPLPVAMFAAVAGLSCWLSMTES